MFFHRTFSGMEVRETFSFLQCFICCFRKMNSGRNTKVRFEQGPAAEGRPRGEVIKGCTEARAARQEGRYKRHFQSRPQSIW